MARRPRLPRLPRSLRVGSVVVVAAVIVYFSLLDAVSPPAAPGPWWDKKLHFAAYGALTLAVAVATVEYRKYGWLRVLGVVAFSLLFGIGIELVQWPLEMRHAAVDDVVANAVGTLLAATAFAVECWLGYAGDGSL